LPFIAVNKIKQRFKCDPGTVDVLSTRYVETSPALAACITTSMTDENAGVCRISSRVSIYVNPLIGHIRELLRLEIRAVAAKKYRNNCIASPIEERAHMRRMLHEFTEVT
jgi:hypothetical protein